VPFDFSPYDAVLLDLDGTLYHEDHALQGAADLVRRIQDEGRLYACLTNSTAGPQRISRRLMQMGMAIPPERIYSAAAAAADCVLHRAAPGRLPRVMNLATEDMHELLDGRVEWVFREHDVRCAAADAIKPCDAIVIGAPTNVYATPDRQRLAMELARKGASLIGICADRVYPSPRGMELGCGALTAMLAYGASVEPQRIIFTGKPEAIFFNELGARLGVSPARCLLIGDNLESDIAGARGVGMDTILVLTGVASEADAQKVASDLRPGRIARDLRELV